MNWEPWSGRSGYEARPVKVVFGPGRVAEAADELAKLGVARAMSVADARAPGADVVAAALGDRLAVHWDEVAQHVPSSHRCME